MRIEALQRSPGIILCTGNGYQIEVVYLEASAAYRYEPDSVIGSVDTSIAAPVGLYPAGSTESLAREPEGDLLGHAGLFRVEEHVYRVLPAELAPATECGRENPEVTGRNAVINPVVLVVETDQRAQSGVLDGIPAHVVALVEVLSLLSYGLAADR